MFSKVNIGDWIMCTKTFSDQRSANKWYQRISGDIDMYFHYKADNGSGLSSTDKVNEFDLENVLTHEQYEAMICDKPKTPTPDMVNNPSHYTIGGIETIDFMRAKLGKDGFKAYCLGNCIKYAARALHKHGDGGNEDIAKMRKYADFALEK